MLQWQETSRGRWEAQLGTQADGVLFSLQYQPTCYRRGPWRLLIEVCGGEHHFKWGCLDEADQPERYYHHHANALSEAEALAEVLWEDRHEERR